MGSWVFGTTAAGVSIRNNEKLCSCVNGSTFRPNGGPWLVDSWTLGESDGFLWISPAWREFILASVLSFDSPRCLALTFWRKSEAKKTIGTKIWHETVCGKVPDSHYAQARENCPDWFGRLELQWNFVAKIELFDQVVEYPCVILCWRDSLFTHMMG